MRRFTLPLLFFILGFVATIPVYGQTTVPNPPEPQVQSEEPAEPPELILPENISVNSHVNVGLKGISLSDVSEGRTLLRIYPKNKVTIFDGISFVKKEPFLILFPKEAGQYNLVFVLKKKDSFVFLEKEFTVTGESEE